MLFQQNVVLKKLYQCKVNCCISQYTLQMYSQRLHTTKHCTDVQSTVACHHTLYRCTVNYFIPPYTTQYQPTVNCSVPPHTVLMYSQQLQPTLPMYNQLLRTTIRCTNVHTDRFSSLIPLA